MDEYHARCMLRYAPFHNIKSGTMYPSFFITVSTEDNGVGPGHARKLAARLAQVGSKAYYVEDSEGEPRCQRWVATPRADGAAHDLSDRSPR